MVLLKCKPVVFFILFIYFHLCILTLINSLKFLHSIINYGLKVFNGDQNRLLFFSMRYILAHLSQRLIGELIGYPWSGVRRPSSSVRPQFSNVFSSETAWPIKAKFYVEPPWEEGTKVYINGPVT